MTIFLILVGTAFAVCLAVVAGAFRKAPLIEDADECPALDLAPHRDLSVRDPMSVPRSGPVVGRHGGARVNLSVR